jgi:uncharacterized membrane protein YidH (DUF202 family)
MHITNNDADALLSLLLMILMFIGVLFSAAAIAEFLAKRNIQRRERQRNRDYWNWIRRGF